MKCVYTPSACLFFTFKSFENFLNSCCNVFQKKDPKILRVFLLKDAKCSLKMTSIPKQPLSNYCRVYLRHTLKFC